METSYYKRSHKADRVELKKNPPTYIEAFNMIEGAHMTKEERAFFAMSVLAGTRVTETLNIQQKDIKVYLQGASSGNPIDPKETSNYLTIGRYDLDRMSVTCENKKSKKNKFKTISITRTELFHKAFDWILDRLQEQKYNPEAKLFDFSRTQCWWMCKRFFGDKFFNHYWRHVKASNDTRFGKSMQIVQREMGWSNLSPAQQYVHLNESDIIKENERVYGPSMIKYHEAIGTTPLPPTNITNKPLGKDAILGAYAASKQTMEVSQDVAFRASRGSIGDAPSNKKYSVIKDNSGTHIVYLPPHARQIRDKIKKEGIRAPIINVIDESSLIQVV